MTNKFTEQFTDNPDDCICDLKPYIESEDEPPRWVHTNQSFRCPYHGMAMLFCRLHRNGFFGSCHLCLLDDAVHKSYFLPGQTDESIDDAS